MIMKNLIFKTAIYAIIIMIASCSGQNALEKYNCKILKTEPMNMIKKTIYIQIPKQLTEVQLKEIATKMRNENKEYEKLFIFYLLPDMTIGSEAWATTHYNTELEINIIGATKKEEGAMKTSTSPEGEIIGKWYDKTSYMEHSVIIFKVNEQFKIKETYKDGSIIEKDLEYSKTNGRSKFTYKNDFGEYLLIEHDGRLGQYDKDGLISTADKME